MPKHTVNVYDAIVASLFKILPAVAEVLGGRCVGDAGWRLAFDFGPTHLLAATVTIELRPDYAAERVTWSTWISGASLSPMRGEPSTQTIAGVAHTHGAAIVAASQFAEVAEAIVRHEVERAAGAAL